MSPEHPEKSADHGLPRRQFVAALGTVVMGAALPIHRWPNVGLRALSPLWGGSGRPASPLLYPPMDLSYFDTPVSAAPSDIKFGCAQITWGDGSDLQAIEDIAAVGYPGIQLRSPVLKQFGSKPGELQDILARHHLTLVALSSGGVKIDPAIEADVIEEHSRNARFVHDIGGLYLQVTDDRPKGRPIVADDYKRLGRVMTEIGKRTADVGIPLGYHNHMGSLGEKPEEVDQIMAAADPRYVKLELDIAHYQQGGGDPVKAIRKYGDRLLFMHLKDLEGPVPEESVAIRRAGTGSKANTYRFVELGRGKVDMKGVMDALRDVKFRGWAIVELDKVPDKARTPKESAMISKQYLEQLGYRVGEAHVTSPDGEAAA